MRHAIPRRWVAMVVGVLCVLGPTCARADEPVPSVERTIALNRLDVDEAVGLIRSVCLQAKMECIITPIPESDGAAGMRLRRHVNVTAPSDVLERVGALFYEKDGAQPTRVFRIALVRAANSDLGRPAQIPPALAATLDEVRDVLHFKFFRLMSTVVLTAAGETRLVGTATDQDNAANYAIAMNVAGALNRTEGVNVREFQLTRGDRELMNTLFYVQFGKPLVVGVSAYPNPGEALFIVITAAEEPELPSTAVDARKATPAPPSTGSFVISRDSVLKGEPLKIGDLSIVSELEADETATSAPLSRGDLEKCLRAAPNWLRSSGDGTTLQIQPPFGHAGDRVLAAYCHDGDILIGGYERRSATEDSLRSAWIFVKAARSATPVRISPLAERFAVGSGPQRMTYRLDEVRAIDPVSRRVLFAGTSESGRASLLTAPFAWGDPGG